jgi:DNA-binding CsgD family transcriptional regulator
MFRYDPNRISELLGHVYDCVTQPDHWRVVIELLCSDLRLINGVLGCYEVSTGNPLLRLQYGMAQQWFDSMPEFGIEMAEFWGGGDKIRSYPAGEVTVHSTTNPDFDHSANRFAREWCRPQGIRDFAAMRLTDDNKSVATLVLSSARELEKPFNEELQLLRFLSPHIRRALDISQLLDLQNIHAVKLQSVLEALPNGVMLLDASGRVLFANSIAEALIRTNDGMRMTGKVLTLRDEIAAKALAHALHSAVDGGLLSERGGGIPAKSSTGAKAVLHVLPLAFGSMRNSINFRAVAAIFMTTELSQATLSKDAMRVLYDLTPAEIRVCELLIDGYSTAEIATRIGVAISTAKTHLLRIFEKTGTKRQVDLVRLIASLQIARTPAPS